MEVKAHGVGCYELVLPPNRRTVIRCRPVSEEKKQVVSTILLQMESQILHSGGFGEPWGFRVRLCIFDSRISVFHASAVPKCMKIFYWHGSAVAALCFSLLPESRIRRYLLRLASHVQVRHVHMRAIIATFSAL